MVNYFNCTMFRLTEVLTLGISQDGMLECHYVELVDSIYHSHGLSQDREGNIQVLSQLKLTKSRFKSTKTAKDSISGWSIVLYVPYGF